MIRQPGRSLAILALVVLGAGLLGLLAPGANADWLVLTNGRALEGTIEEETEEAVRFRLPGGVVTVPRDRIRSLHRGEKPPAEVAESERRRIEDKSEDGPKGPAEFRYLDGSGAKADEVDIPVFTVLKPAGKLAHGSLVKILEVKRINGVPMARVSLGEVDGWLPADRLRQGPATPVLQER